MPPESELNKQAATNDSAAESDQRGGSDNSVDAKLLSDFWRSAVKSGVENPYNALAQLANHATGKDSVHEVHLTEAPRPVHSGFSVRGITESAGSIAGMLPTFWLTNKAVGGMAGLFKTAETAESVSLVGGLSVNTRKFALGQAALTGAAYSGLLTPTDNQHNFWSSRAANAVFGASAVTAMGWASYRFPEMSPAASGLLGGTIGGAINAEGQALFYKHKLLPTAGDLAQSVTAYGTMGALSARFNPWGSKIEETASPANESSGSPLKTGDLNQQITEYESRPSKVPLSERLASADTPSQRVTVPEVKEQEVVNASRAERPSHAERPDMPPDWKLPKLDLRPDSYSLQARVPGYPRSAFRMEVPEEPGKVNVTDIFSSDMPKGGGSKLLAQALRDFKELPTRQLKISSIHEPNTEAAYLAKQPPESSLLGKMATKSLKELGIEPKSYRWDVIRGKLALIIDTQ